mmetsp:Transcript_5488/g.6844  ORF Transcript_5488/g.6844 Transcript_5488/m.6844 type:complete len:253 (+) Transcript_5488:53-811(+)
MSSISTLLCITQWVVEVTIGIYVLDLISGLVHMHLDYQEIKNRELRLHAEKSIPDVIKFEENDPLFYKATPNDQYLWNFHVHHDAPYPSKDTEFELTMQIVRPLAIPYILSVVLCYMGYMHPTFARIWFGALTTGPLMQKTHFGAHARNHGVLNRETYVGALLCSLQDWGILLSPEEHKKHHEEFDCNFCIFNGWANPVVNQLRVFLSFTGIYPVDPPTRANRKERAADIAAKKLTGKDEKMKSSILNKAAN